MTPSISYTTECRTINVKTCPATSYKEMCQNFNGYELIPNDRKVKPYFDIEIKPKHCNNGQEYLDVATDIANIAMAEIIKYFSNPKVALLNASSANYKCCQTGETKWIISLHIVLSNFKISKAKCLSIVKEMNQTLILKQEVGDYFDLKDTAFQLFDESIYDANRKIRSCFSNKTHWNKDSNELIIEDRPFMIDNDAPFEDTIITEFFDKDTTEIPDNLSSLPLKESVSKVYLLEQKKQDKFLELLDIIGGNKKKVQHNDWFKIGSILKTNSYSKEIFNNFTNQYVSNKNVELDNIWEKNIHMDKIYSIYGLQKIAKEYNLGSYNDWFIRHKQYIPIKVFQKGNNDIAKYISDKLSETLVYCNKTWIMFDIKINLWRVTDAPQTKVCNFIQHLIDCSLETLLYKINKIDDEDEHKKLKTIQSIYETYRGNMADNKENSMIIKFLKDYLNNNEFFAQLDVNKYQVAYKNGLLDLKTLIFREGLLPSDMLTKTISYNYEKGLEEDINKIRFELLKICNNNEIHLEYYLSTLGYAMTGDSIKLQEFYYIIGQKASNGKSVIFEALNDLIPCYSMKIESSSFEIKNATLHKEIATWKGIRIGWINELTKNKQDAEIIKQVADGTSIKYKVMYGISDNMPITFKPFIISNHSPTIDADEGIARRLKPFQMDSEFIEGLEEDNFEKCQFKRDSNFGTLLRTTYKFALMDLIYSYSKKFVDNNKLADYPSEWIEVKKEMITNNNVFGEFILEHFEFDKNYEISEYNLKQFLKQNKFENIKINDEIKKNKWNIHRNRENKKWNGFRIKEIDDN